MWVKKRPQSQNVSRERERERKLSARLPLATETTSTASSVPSLPLQQTPKTPQGRSLLKSNHLTSRQRHRSRRHFPTGGSSKTGVHHAHFLVIKAATCAQFIHRPIIWSNIRCVGRFCARLLHTGPSHRFVLFQRWLISHGLGLSPHSHILPTTNNGMSTSRKVHPLTWRWLFNSCDHHQVFFSS